MKEAKAEARRIIDEFKPHAHYYTHDLALQSAMDEEQLANAIECALIYVDGILNLHTLDAGKGLMISGCNEDYLFWQSVRAIIEQS